MKCSNCGRIFDYEKYYGICPKCGTFNRKQETAKVPEEDTGFSGEISFDTSETDGDAFTFVDDGPAREKQARSLRRETSVGEKVFRRICILLIVLSLAASVVTDIVQERLLKQEARLSEAIPVQSMPYQERFVIGTRTLTVESVRLLEAADTRLEFPEGENCIAVHIQMENSEEYPSYWKRLETPFLGYEDGAGGSIYKAAVSEYDFSAYEAYYGIYLMEDYDIAYSTEAEGELIYFVDAAADTAKLCFEERRREDGKMEQLVQVYEVEIPLPKEVAE